MTIAYNAFKGAVIGANLAHHYYPTATNLIYHGGRALIAYKGLQYLKKKMDIRSRHTHAATHWTRLPHSIRRRDKSAVKVTKVVRGFLARRLARRRRSSANTIKTAFRNRFGIRPGGGAYHRAHLSFRHHARIQAATHKTPHGRYLSRKFYGK